MDVRRVAGSLAFLAVLSSAAAAQEARLTLDAPRLPEALRETGEEGAVALPAEPVSRASKFWLGARAGYLSHRDAEEASWFGGVQARLFLNDWLALEGSVTFHQSEFLDDAVKVTQYPVQATVLLYPFREWQVQPYALGGAGWYYTRTTYHDSLSFLDSETDHTFGVHLGAGAELVLTPKMTVNADVRYVFMDEPGVDNSKLEDEEWDFWQITLGLNFGF